MTVYYVYTCLKKFFNKYPYKEKMISYYSFQQMIALLNEWMYFKMRKKKKKKFRNNEKKVWMLVRHYIICEFWMQIMTYKQITVYCGHL